MTSFDVSVTGIVCGIAHCMFDTALNNKRVIDAIHWQCSGVHNSKHVSMLRADVFDTNSKFVCKNTSTKN